MKLGLGQIPFKRKITEAEKVIGFFGTLAAGLIAVEGFNPRTQTDGILPSNKLVSRIERLDKTRADLDEERRNGLVTKEEADKKLERILAKHTNLNNILWGRRTKASSDSKIAAGPALTLPGSEDEIPTYLRAEFAALKKHHNPNDPESMKAIANFWGRAMAEKHAPGDLEEAKRYLTAAKIAVEMAQKAKSQTPTQADELTEIATKAGEKVARKNVKQFLIANNQ